MNEPTAVKHIADTTGRKCARCKVSLDEGSWTPGTVIIDTKSSEWCSEKYFGGVAEECEAV